MGTISTRAIALKHPEAASRSMALPEDVYCGSCKGFPWCEKLSDIDAMSEVCQWYPNRYTSVRGEK